MTPCCPRVIKRTNGISKSAIPLCSPTSLVGVWRRQSLWKRNLLKYLVKREMILVSLKVWRHDVFAEYVLWQPGRTLSDTTKFVNRLRNANLHKKYQHLCKYVTQRISWVGRQPTQAKTVRFCPNCTISDILVQSGTDRWLQGYHLRRTLTLVPDPDMLHGIVHLWPSLGHSSMCFARIGAFKN